MSEKGKCEAAIAYALRTAAMFPHLFSKEELLRPVCEQYGTEYVAERMLEMGGRK